MDDRRRTEQERRKRQDSRCWAEQSWTVGLFDFTAATRSHLIRQSGKRASPLNQDEFRLERWRNRVHLGREVLFDLVEVGIEDLDDRSRKLLEFV